MYCFFYTHWSLKKPALFLHQFSLKNIMHVLAYHIKIGKINRIFNFGYGRGLYFSLGFQVYLLWNSCVIKTYSWVLNINRNFKFATSKSIFCCDQKSCKLFLETKNDDDVKIYLKSQCRKCKQHA